MQTTSRAYGWLTRLRQTFVLLMLLECADVLSEKTIGMDVVPTTLDIEVVLAAFVFGLAALALEVLEGPVRRRARVDGLALAVRVEAEREATRVRRERTSRIERVLEGHDYPEMVFQPIADLSSGAVKGYEALSRFAVGRPDEWFAEAAAVGLGLEFELKAIERAVSELQQLPGDSPYLSLNASPATLVSAELLTLLSSVDTTRIVLELTEHVPISDYDAIRRAVSALRDRGARLAVDDAGAGYASLRHIALLEPDIIKLDASFTKALHTDPVERSMVSALVGLGRSVGALIVAEGIEDECGLITARELGVETGQGWHIGMPASIETLHATLLVPSQRTAV